MQNAVNATESMQVKKPYDDIAQCEKIAPLAFDLVLAVFLT